MVDDAFEALGSLVQPAWEVTYVPTALALVRAGLGVTILPESVLEMESGRHLRAHPIREPDLERRVGVIQAIGRSLSPAAEVFVQALRAGCAEVKPGERRESGKAFPSAHRAFAAAGVESRNS
jgi:LysR family carnitine catabolism transcriptional activator